MAIIEALETLESYNEAGFETLVKTNVHVHRPPAVTLNETP